MLAAAPHRPAQPLLPSAQDVYKRQSTRSAYCAALDQPLWLSVQGKNLRSDSMVRIGILRKRRGQGTPPQCPTTVTQPMEPRSSRWTSYTVRAYVPSWQHKRPPYRSARFSIAFAEGGVLTSSGRNAYDEQTPVCYQPPESILCLIPSLHLRHFLRAQKRGGHPCIFSS